MLNVVCIHNDDNATNKNVYVLKGKAQIKRLTMD